MFTVKTQLPLLVRRIRRAQGKLQEDNQRLLEVLGVQLLSLSLQAYRVKARGERGSDGIKWKKLKRGTLENRVRRRAESRRIVSRRRRLAREARDAKPDKAKRLRKQRKDLFARHESLVDREVANHEIGVDTGLQRSSASPGFSGTDGRGGNFFDIRGTQVTVGYNRSYSKHFDRVRKLLPDTLPDAWQQKMEEQTLTWAESIIQEING